MIRALLCGVLASCALTTASFAQSASDKSIADERKATAGPTVLFDRHGPREVTLVPASEALSMTSKRGVLENIYRHAVAKKQLTLVSGEAAMTNVSNVRGGELMLLRYFEQAPRSVTRTES